MLPYDPNRQVGAEVDHAMKVALDHGANQVDLILIITEVASLFDAAVQRPRSFDQERVHHLMDLAIIGLLHERGYIP